MKVIFVAGSWGSGTSMVMGALDRLGVATFGPYFRSYDSRTQNTFELSAFRKIILDHVDETSMSPKGIFGSEEDFNQQLTSALQLLGERLERGEFGPWPRGMPKIVALKMPLASMYLPVIKQAFDADIIMIHRPLKEIEASRVRRRWPALFGAQGANRLYLKMFTDLVGSRLSALVLSHHDFRMDTRGSMKKIIDYCDLQFPESNLEHAISFVRND